MTLHFTIHTEKIVNLWTETTHANSYAVDAATGHRIAGTDGTTEDDARWMTKHWHSGATEIAPTHGSLPITRIGAWPEGSRQ